MMMLYQQIYKVGALSIFTMPKIYVKDLFVKEYIKINKIVGSLKINLNW